MQALTEVQDTADKPLVRPEPACVPVSRNQGTFVTMRAPERVKVVVIAGLGWTSVSRARPTGLADKLRMTTRVPMTGSDTATSALVACVWEGRSPGVCHQPNRRARHVDAWRRFAPSCAPSCAPLPCMANRPPPRMERRSSRALGV